jgi:transposase
LVSRGRSAAYKQTHARILLMSDEAQAGGAMKDDDIARALHIGRATVERVRRRCVEEGIEAAVGRKQQVRRRQKKLDGQAEAHLIALACTKPPQGRTSWTLKLLAERLVACSIVERISTETVRRTLKKLVLV